MKPEKQPYTGHRGYERKSSSWDVLELIGVTHCPSNLSCSGNFPFLHFAGLCPGRGNGNSH